MKNITLLTITTLLTSLSFSNVTANAQTTLSSTEKKIIQSVESSFSEEMKFLEKIVNIGVADGEFDEQEKAVLVNIISNLTRADMNDAMWLKVDELIHKFDLHDDSEAFIEHLDDDSEY